MCLHGQLLHQRRFLSLLLSMPNTAATSQDGYWHDAFCRCWYDTESWISAHCSCAFAWYLAWPHNQTSSRSGTKRPALCPLSCAQSLQAHTGRRDRTGKVFTILLASLATIEMLWGEAKTRAEWVVQWRRAPMRGANSGMKRTFNGGNGWEIGAISHYESGLIITKHYCKSSSTDFRNKIS